jgi:FKBP-type peptidyl-prolyl cis-trans isomerase FklB
MMTRLTLHGLVLGGTMLLAAPACAEEPPALKTQKDKVSYAIGVDVARNFKKQEVDVDPDLLMRGLKDMLSGQRLLMSEKDIRQITQLFQAEVRKKMITNQRSTATENRLKGVAFLAENKAKDGVFSLPSGVQYKTLKTGDGKKPTDSDTIECHYRGTLLDGTEFDGTNPGKPATLKVAQLIPGWKEAVKLMPVGSTWQLFIPSQLAYGERGVGRDIGPNETLIFEVELLAIK